MVAGLRNFLFGSMRRIAGVTVSFKNREEIVYHAIIVSKNRNSITIDSTVSGCNTLEKIKEALPQNCPVVVNIEGWGVLVKKLSKNTDGVVDTTLIPDNNDDFEVFMHDQTENVIASVVRKELLTEVITEFRRLSLNLAGMSAGPGAVGLLIPILGMDGKQPVGSWSLEIVGNEITEIKTLQEQEYCEYYFGGESVSSLLLGSLGLVVGYLSGNTGSEPVNDNLNGAFVYRRLTFLSTLAVFLILFAALVINFLLFDRYSKKYDTVSNEYIRNETIIRELRNAEEELKKREAIISGTGLERKNQFAWYSDRLALLKPAKVLLTRLAIQPPERKIQVGREIIFKSNLLIVEGETSDLIQVHYWINHIRKEEWVLDIELASYTGQGSNRGSFILEIKF